ncbi:MAG TPA: hypothetical protein VF883_19010 [Thermoanaerobaculia bacterium]|jgi:hypothetical protein
MNPRLFLPFLLLSVLAVPAFAQQPPRNAAYVEIGGNGIIPTINYERRFSDRFAGRIGFSIVTSEESGGEEDVTFAIPVMANFISHPRLNHHFEAGGGVLFVVGDEQDFSIGNDGEEIANVALTGLAGYRFQRPGRGFVFRAGITPFYFDGDFAPWAGVSFGYGW